MYFKEAYDKAKEGDKLVHHRNTGGKIVVKKSVDTMLNAYEEIYAEHKETLEMLLSDQWEIEKKKVKKTEVLMIDTGYDGVLYKNIYSSSCRVIPNGTKVTIEWEE